MSRQSFAEEQTIFPRKVCAFVTDKSTNSKTPKRDAITAYVSGFSFPVIARGARLSRHCEGVARGNPGLLYGIASRSLAMTSPSPRACVPHAHVTPSTVFHAHVPPSVSRGVCLLRKKRFLRSVPYGTAVEMTIKEAVALRSK